MTTSKPSLVAGNIQDPQPLALSLNESHELLALAEESAGIGAWDRDIATSMMRGTPTFFRMMGLEPSAEPVHMDSVRAVRHPEDAARVVEGFEQALARGLDTYESEYRIVRPSDGQLRWILGRGRAMRDATGRPIRYCGVDIDITERKQAETHIRLLMNEVNHRANNLLAVVQAIARHTLGTTDPSEYAERLSRRIAGLAASNNLLVSGKWQGVDFGELINSQLSHSSDLGRRVGLDGPPVRLKPAAAQAIGMALHELATNALKYGAFANRAGDVLIGWSVAGEGDERAFRMTWTERGGPPVAAPTRTGFGHTVMKQMIEGALGGKADIEFAADGLAWSFVGPAAQVLDVDR